MNGALIVGALIGFMVALFLIVTVMVLSFKFDGDIHVKYDGDDGPYFFLEVDSPKQIEKKGIVIFRVKKK
ncbi:MAG: hypothetical protein J6U54_07245 [Clostridiales bacterium]|nr:hypothetical protein [Clostridiales bacterium]